MNEINKEFKPSPAESFEIDYLNARIVDAQNAMSNLGFVITQSGVQEKDKVVFFEGKASDGTKIKMTIERGERYKTPAEIETEREAVEKQ